MKKSLRLLAVFFLFVLVACEQAIQENPVIEPTGNATSSPTADGSTPGGAQTGNTEVPGDCRNVPGTGVDAGEVEAEDNKFDTDCLVTHANVAFRIELKNRDDGVGHTWSLYDNSPGGAARFSGEVVNGRGEKIYDVPAQPVGIYRFQCDIHPSMNGQFHVVEARDG